MNPREWWIVDGNQGYRVYDDEDEAIRYAGYLAEQNPTFNHHVVERSALDAALEREKILEDFLTKTGRTHCPPELECTDFKDGYQQALDDLKEWARKALAKVREMRAK